MRWIAAFFCCLLLIAPTVVRAQVEGVQLVGFDAVQRAIDEQRIDRFSELNGRTFSLTLSPGATGLTITPSEVFELVGSGTVYTLRIVNAQALLVNEGGLIEKRRVRWDAAIGGDVRFDLQIAGVDECVFNLTFRQVNGPSIDLTAIQASYDVSWAFSQQNAVNASEINGSSLRITRVAGNTAPLSVRLRLVRKSDGRIIESPPVAIQVCARDVRTDNGDVGILQIRTPPQCINRTRYQEDRFNTTSTTGVNYQATYANNCDRPVRCELVWRMYRYNSVADGIARVNANQVSYYNFSMVLQAFSSERRDFFLSTDEINYPYYSWSGLWLPHNAAPGYQDTDFVCRWAT